MHISSYSPSMDEWQVVVADRSAPSSCARRKSLPRRPSKIFPDIFASKSLLVSGAYFFETPSADRSSHSLIRLSGVLYRQPVN